MQIKDSLVTICNELKIQNIEDYQNITSDHDEVSH